MSPTEHDLRAALRDGEDDGGGALNVDRIVHQGRAARARRRSQLLNGAAAAVLVSGLGVGGAFLLSGNDGGQNSGGASRQLDGGSQPYGGAKAAAPNNADGAGGGASLAPSARANAAGSVECPKSLPRYLLPPTAAGSGGALYSGPVATVVVCAYGDSGSKPPTRVVLTGEDAKVMVDSLEQASSTKPLEMCPNYRRADEQSLAVIGLDAAGERVGLVTTTLGRPACAVDVRNGKVVRYGWQPPASLAIRLHAVVPEGGMSHGPVVQSGSPTK